MDGYIGWVVFGIVMFAILYIDLKIVNKDAHEIKVKEALKTTLAVIVVGVLFGLFVYWSRGSQAGLQFFAGYLIEYSLSVDNLFVFIIIFSIFKVPGIYRHRVLFWGILLAIVFRAIFIFAGVAIINSLHFVIYILGVFLIYTGIKLLFKKDDDDGNSIKDGFAFKLTKRFIPVTSDYHGESFFVRLDGKMVATPLFLCLVIINVVDIMFAFDSVPAILTISRDPFIVFTSNMFALLGLRSLYFALSGVMQLFHFLNYGLAAILTFIGVKIMLEDYYVIPISAALGVVAGVLAVSVILSVIFKKK